MFLILNDIVPIHVLGFFQQVYSLDYEHNIDMHKIDFLRA